MVLGGGEADVEAEGDLFVGEAVPQEGEDLSLPGGEDVGVGRAAALAHGEISVRRVRWNYTSRQGKLSAFSIQRSAGEGRPGKRGLGAPLIPSTLLRAGVRVPHDERAGAKAGPRARAGGRA